ncbi:hypothetical protein FQR65_LT09801 [Abscondita terminalis]|nr:hypothetical protein FQR65_LT09801 [Abscondita terminalis]
MSLCSVLLELLLIFNTFASEELISVTQKNDNESLSTTPKVLTQKLVNATAGEADDLLHGGEFNNITHHIENGQQSAVSYSEDVDHFKNNGKWDIELIEDGSNTEDDRVKIFLLNSQHSKGNNDLVIILVLSVIVVILGGYGTYYVWRKLE